MPQTVCTAAVNRALRAVHRPVSDGELVERFAATGDSDAFSQLVHRHGAMVLAVCRRITRHHQDAEDAFQATFLVLARRAGAVNTSRAVAGWLFGVAVNAAREARRRSARRYNRESLTATPPETGRCESDPDFDTRAVVAEELAGLPEGYRSLVVACDLQGESQAAVARRLGLPVGTVYSRLSTARRILAERLGRRGFSAPACLVALAAFAANVGALPPVSDCPSPHVTELTEAIMRRGFAVRWKLAACALLASVAVAFSGEPPKEKPIIAPAQVVAEESRLILGLGGHVRFLKPDGTEVSRLTGAEAVKAGADMPTRSLSVGLSSDVGLTTTVSEIFGPSGRIAPDGRLPLNTRKGLCMLTQGDPLVVKPVKAATGEGALFASGNVPYIVAWSPDAKKAIGFRIKRGLFGSVYEHVLIDLVAGTTSELKVPSMHRVVDWSPDGSWFLTIRENKTWGLEGLYAKERVLCKVSVNGKTSRALTPTGGNGPGQSVVVESAVLSPDGTRVAYQQWTTTLAQQAKEGPVYCQGLDVVVLDLDRGTRTVVASEPGGKGPGDFLQMNTSFGVRWSPDGSRVGFLYEHREFGTPFVVAWRVGVVNANGGKVKTVFASDKVDKTPPTALTTFDWR